MNNKQLGFLFHKELCIQCHACESACKNWRMTEKGIQWRQITHIWQGTYPDISGYSLSLSCYHCADPECMKVCPTKAIYKNQEHGIVLINPDQCVGCRRCLDACPFDVPKFGSNGRMQKCDMCFGDPDIFETKNPPCVRTCPVHALELKWMDDKEKMECEKNIMKDLASTP